jgi:hypothetical protein
MPDGLRRMEPSGSPVRMDSLNSNRTSTRSRLSRERDYPVNLGGHDKIVLMQSLDLFGLQRNGNIAPTEADIRMMAFRFRELTNLLNKGKRSRKFLNQKLRSMRCASSCSCQSGVCT